MQRAVDEHAELNAVAFGEGRGLKLEGRACARPREPQAKHLAQQVERRPHYLTQAGERADRRSAWDRRRARPGRRKEVAS